MSSRALQALARLIGVLVCAGLLVAALRSLDLARTAEALASVRLGWVLLACLLYVTILPLWATQWRIIAPHTANNTWPRMLGVVSLTSATLNTTPLLIGEVAGVMLLVSRIGVSAAEAISVSAMDQLLVGIAKVCVIASAALTNPIPSWMQNGLGGLAAGVSLLLAASALLAFNPDARDWGIAHRLPARVVDSIHHFATGLAPLRSPTRSAPALVLALLKKLAEILAILALQRAFGIELPGTSALLVLAALNLATIVPMVPGNLGVYEGVVTLAYVTLGVPPERAAAVAVVQHACFFASLALPGYAWLGAAGVSRTIAAAR